MNTGLLNSSDTGVAKTYVTKKFKSFNSWAYPAKKRDAKCMSYWIATQGHDANRSIVENTYFLIFKTPFPTAAAIALQEARDAVPRKVEASEWYDIKEGRLADANRALVQLREFQRNQDYQNGEGFFLELQSAVGFLEEDIFREQFFDVEHNVKRVGELTGTTERTAKSLSAEFEGMIGMKADAKVEFQSRAHNWGDINAKLETAFKAGAWTSGSAKAEMTRLKFSADIQGAIAIGAQLDVSGSCTWKKGNVGLQLAGNGQCFVGGEAKGAAKLSVSALKGIEAAFAAEAFVGFRAEINGSCSFQYKGQSLVTATGTAGVVFGAGGGFEATLSAPIFGPTEFSFSSSVALGLGVSSGVAFQVNFSECYLAGRENFRKVIYLPTLAKGYKMDLMTTEARNKHYLEKATLRVEAEIASLEESLDAFNDTPSERQSLLRYAD